MKILFLTTHLNYGGITTYVTELARILTSRGHKVFIASSGGEGRAGLDAGRIPHYRVSINTKSEVHPKLIFAIFSLSRLIKREKIEIIHTHTRVTQIVGEILSRMSGVSHISTCHGFFKLRLFRRIVPAWGKKVVAISEAVRAHLVADFRVPKEKVVVITNGVDLKQFSVRISPPEKLHAKAAFGLKPAPVIGIIARLSPVKGHKYLLQAFAEVLGAHPETQLLIIGDGGEEKNLKELSRKLSLEEKVFFHPSVRDTNFPLKALDIFVLPSLAEGLGLSIIEAMAAGLPVVASNVGGIYTLVKDGETGLLVPPRDAGALAVALQKLLEDRELALRFGKAGRKRAEEEFSLEEMAEKMEKLYRELIS